MNGTFGNNAYQGCDPKYKLRGMLDIQVRTNYIINKQGISVLQYVPYSTFDLSEVHRKLQEYN